MAEAAYLPVNDPPRDEGENNDSELALQYAEEAKRKGEMTSSITTLRINPKYSDVTIICGTETFPAHKAIICPQSEFFAKVFDSHFAEAYSETIKLPDHPLMIRILLDYLYTSDYNFYLAYNFPAALLADGQMPPSDYVDRLHCCEISIHIQMYILADRLLIKGLKILAQQKLAKILEIVSFPTVYPRAVREIYRVTSVHHQALREAVVDFTVKVWTSQIERSHFDFNFPKHILEEIPEFTYDLTTKLVDEWVEEEKKESMDPTQLADTFRLC